MTADEWVEQTDKEKLGHRLDAIEKNVQWLREHDLDEHRFEAAKRVGLIFGDATALKRLLGDKND